MFSFENLASGHPYHPSELENPMSKSINVLIVQFTQNYLSTIRFEISRNINVKLSVQSFKTNSTV